MPCSEYRSESLEFFAAFPSFSGQADFQLTGKHSSDRHFYFPRRLCQRHHWLLVVAESKGLERCHYLHRASAVGDSLVPYVRLIVLRIPSLLPLGMVFMPFVLIVVILALPNRSACRTHGLANRM